MLSSDISNKIIYQQLLRHMGDLHNVELIRSLRNHNVISKEPVLGPVFEAVLILSYDRSNHCNDFEAVEVHMIILGLI